MPDNSLQFTLTLGKAPPSPLLLFQEDEGDALAARLQQQLSVADEVGVKLVRCISALALPLPLCGRPWHARCMQQQPAAASRASGQGAAPAQLRSDWHRSTDQVGAGQAHRLHVRRRHLRVSG